MLLRLLDKLALFFCVVVPLAAVAWSLAPYDFDKSVGPFRLAIYTLLFLGEWGIWLFYLKLLLNSPDGRAPIWSVVAFYVSLFLGLALLGVEVVLSLRAFFPGLAEGHVFFRASYGLIGGSATATFAGAVVAWVGYRRGGRKLMGRRIEWRPGSAKNRSRGE